LADRENVSAFADRPSYPVVRTGAWISEAWEIVQSEFWVFLMAGLVISFVGNIPYVTTALLCGLIAIAFQKTQGAAKANLDVVGRCFHADIGLPAFLAMLVQSALMTLAAIPMGAIMIIGFLASASEQEPTLAVPPFLAAIALFLVCCFVMSVMWMFTYPIITDRRCGFWQAMELSRKTVFRDFLGFCGFAIVLGLVQLLGVLLCFVGVLVTTPLIYVALAVAYRDVFGLQSAQEIPVYAPYPGPYAAPPPPPPYPNAATSSESTDKPYAPPSPQ